MGGQLTLDVPGFQIGRGQRAPDICRPTVARDRLEEKYASIIKTNPWLDRTLVSFQANKELPFYRWFKYREGFAAPMVKKVLSGLFDKPGTLLDPFAGAGSALFAGRELGWKTTGIELLPSAVFAIQSRLAAEELDRTEFAKAVQRFLSGKWKDIEPAKAGFRHVRITRGAFPDETETLLGKYLQFIRDARFSDDVRQLMRFAAYCVLEDISFTRKDGQYLRWDYRSGKQLGGKQFNKGQIVPFENALAAQLKMMVDDLAGNSNSLFPDLVGAGKGPHPRLIEQSCLTGLPQLKRGSFDCVFTSPPYCNRYDYTRTYALELAFLGCDEQRIKDLRQQMLFCTVENKPKQDLSNDFRAVDLDTAQRAFNSQSALQEVLSILDQLKELGALNNPGISKLVRNYFSELNLVVRECTRVLRKNGYFVMVNDNVRYAGETVPVDTIMSDLAKTAGLHPVGIWKLGRGKGNSSQQMGTHGRSELRKTICVWQKR
jgi:hypothetical protein